MQFARLALISVPKKPAEWDRVVLTAGAFQIATFFETVRNDAHVRLVAAVTTLTNPLSLAEDGRVVIPDEVREDAERLIEIYANLMAVSEHMTRDISSPHPCVLLKAESQDEIALLESPSGIAVPSGNRAVPSGALKFDVSAHLKELADRMDGVAILAEALAHRQASGKFRDGIRFFERAFSLAGRHLTPALSEFLTTSGDGYTEAEVTNWIRIRHDITHADRAKPILYDVDVMWVVDRLIQANYDVLLNKQNWHSADALRREAWRSSSGTTENGSSMRATQGQDLSFEFKVFDEFRRFPANLQGSLSAIPGGSWAGNRSDSELSCADRNLTGNEEAAR